MGEALLTGWPNQSQKLMNMWLRLNLVVLTVGGGFMGCVLSGMAIPSQLTQLGHLPDPSAPLGFVGSLFVLISGLVFVQKPGSTCPRRRRPCNTNSRDQNREIRVPVRIGYLRTSGLDKSPHRWLIQSRGSCAVLD